MDKSREQELEQEFPYLARIESISDEIRNTLYSKEADYQGSWKKSGGQGAFMMLARKWDRIEAIAKKNGYDLFDSLIRNDGDVADDVKDLIGYLLLVLSVTKPKVETISSSQIDEPCQCTACLIERENKSFKNVRMTDGMEHPFGYDAEKDA